MKKISSDHYLIVLKKDIICHTYTTQNKQTDINQ